jgi:type II secretory pathway component PulC
LVWPLSLRGVIPMGEIEKGLVALITILVVMAIEAVLVWYFTTEHVKNQMAADQKSVAASAADQRAKIVALTKAEVAKIPLMTPEDIAKKILE